MEVSNKFRNINANLEKIFEAICENKTIAKLVFYLDHDPISKPDVSINMLKEGYYFINFFDGSIPEKDKIRLFVNFIDGDFSRPTSGTGTLDFLIEIVIPMKYWVLSGKSELRAVNVLDEIAMMIDQQLGFGIGQARVTRCRSSKVSGADYNVMSANIRVNSSSLKGLR